MQSTNPVLTRLGEATTTEAVERIVEDRMTIDGVVVRLLSHLRR